MKIIQKEVKTGRQNGDSGDVILKRIQNQISDDVLFRYCIRLTQYIDEVVDKLLKDEDAIFDFNSLGYSFLSGDSIKRNNVYKFLFKELRKHGIEIVYYEEWIDKEQFHLYMNGDKVLEKMWSYDDIDAWDMFYTVDLRKKKPFVVRGIFYISKKWGNRYE